MISKSFQNHLCLFYYLFQYHDEMACLSGPSVIN